MRFRWHAGLGNALVTREARAGLNLNRHDAHPDWHLTEGWEAHRPSVLSRREGFLLADANSLWSMPVLAPRDRTYEGACGCMVFLSLVRCTGWLLHGATGTSIWCKSIEQLHLAAVMGL